MSLSAKVYKNRSSIPTDLDSIRAQKDRRTGEYYVEPGVLEPETQRRLFVAESQWLGNADSVAQLRKELIALTGSEDLLLLRKCLYSGTHSGDLIQVHEASLLDSEVLNLLYRYRSRISVELEEFLSRTLKLTRASQQENNPVVFV